MNVVPKEGEPAHCSLCRDRHEAGHAIKLSVVKAWLDNHPIPLEEARQRLGRSVQQSLAVEGVDVTLEDVLEAMARRGLT